MTASVVAPDKHLPVVVELSKHFVAVAPAAAAAVAVVGRCHANRRDWRIVAFEVPFEDPRLAPACSGPLYLRFSYASS